MLEGKVWLGKGIGCMSRYQNFTYKYNNIWESSSKYYSSARLSRVFCQQLILKDLFSCQLSAKKEEKMQGIAGTRFYSINCNDNFRRKRFYATFATGCRSYKRQHYGVSQEPIEKMDLLEVIQTKGFQTLLSMALECTTKSSFLFQKFCTFLLSGPTIFDLSDECFREIIKAYRRIFNNPKATFVFFRDLHKAFPKTIVNDSLLVFLINYAIENKLQREALEVAEFYWTNPNVNLMQFTKSVYKMFKYFEARRNLNEIESLCAKTVQYFERFPSQKIPIQLATILLTQYSVKLNIYCNTEIERLVALVPADNLDWKFRAQLVKTYSRLNSPSEIEQLFSQHGYLIPYLAKYQSPTLDNAMVVLCKSTSSDKLSGYLKKVGSYPIKLENLSWYFGHSQNNLLQMNADVKNSLIATKFLEGILAQQFHSLVEVKLTSLYGQRKEIDIIEFLLVERICKKFNLINSFTSLSNEQLSLFNLAKESSEVESLLKVAHSPDNHRLIMEGILASSNSFDNLKLYLSNYPEKKYQYWTEEFSNLVLECNEGWNTILNPLMNWTITDEMKLKLVSGSIKFQLLEERDFERKIIELFSAENGSIYQPILGEIIELCLRRYRNAAICERILFFVLDRFENLTFFLPFFKIINWYKLHGELEAIEKLISKLNNYNVSSDNQIIQYSQLVLGTRCYSNSFYPQYYFLLNNGFKEKAWELIKSSFPTCKSRGAYLNILFECERFDEYLIEISKDLEKADIGKFCFALITTNRMSELEKFSLDDSHSERIIEAFVRQNNIDDAFNQMQKTRFVSVERREELFCSSVTLFRSKITEQLISMWKLKEFSPKMLKYLIRYCCMKKRIPFAYEVASLFFSKFGNSVDYAVSIANTLAVYSNARMLLSHYFPLMITHSVKTPLIAYYKILRHYTEELNSERVSHYLSILNSLKYPVHPKLIESIIDLKLAISDTVLNDSLLLLQNSPLKISDSLRLLLMKQLLIFPSNYEQCHELIFNSPTSTIELFDALLEFHFTNFVKEISLEKACNIFEEICLRNIDYSNETVNFMLSIFAKNFDIESIEIFSNLFKLQEDCPFQLTPGTIELITTAFFYKCEHERGNRFILLNTKNNSQLSMEIKYLLETETRKSGNEPNSIDSSNENEQNAIDLIENQNIEKLFCTYPNKRMQIADFYIEHSLQPFTALAKWATKQLSVDKGKQFQNLLGMWGIIYDAEMDELVAKSIEDDIEYLSGEQN